MTRAAADLASVPVLAFFPDETPGAFIERFVDAAGGKPIDLVASVVWRACDRAYSDGMIEGIRSAPLVRAELELAGDADLDDEFGEGEP